MAPKALGCRTAVPFPVALPASCCPLLPCIDWHCMAPRTSLLYCTSQDTDMQDRPGKATDQLA